MAASHEVRVVVNDRDIIHQFVFAGIENFFNCDPPAVVTVQPVAGPKQSGLNPTALIDPEWMLQRRTNNLSADVKVEDVGRTHL